MLFAFAFVFVAHAVDPCTLGLWELRSSAGSATLCERFGSVLNIHTRVHLLLHALPTAVWAVVFERALRGLSGAGRGA